MEQTHQGHIPVEWFQKYQSYQCEQYPAWWARMNAQWNDPACRDYFWHQSSSSYVLRLADTLFAVDPVWLLPGVFDAIAHRLMQDLQSLDCILLTHHHGDHFDREHIPLLKDLDLQWIVPACMEEEFRATGIPAEKIIIMHPGDRITVKDITIEAFLGRHHYPDGAPAPESLMYTVRSPEKSVCFLADVRDFKPEYIPDGGPFDAVFLNIYLHRFNGYDYPFADYYQPLVKFAAALDTQKLFIGHVWGFQCEHPDLIWNYMHTGMLEDGLVCLRPDMDVIVPKVGRSYPI